MSIWTIVMVLAILIFVVLPTLKPRTFHVKKLLLTPAVFMYLLYDSLTSQFYLDQKSFGVIVLGIIVGAAVGFFLRRNTKITVNHEYKLITAQGSCSALIVFVVIFSVHFLVGYLKTTQPSIFLTANPSEYALIFALVLVSSMTIGTSGAVFYKYLKS